MGETFLTWLVGDGAKGVTETHFVFDSPLGTLGGLIFLVLITVLVALLYPKRLAGFDQRKRRLITALRTFAVCLAAFLMLNPALEGFRFDPRENYLLLLHDNSASMAIAPQGGISRGKRLQTAYQAALADFEEPLSERFQLAHYSFGTGVQRIRDIQDLSFDSPESAIQDAIKTALGDFQGINVSAVVVFSDGVEQPQQSKVLLDDRVPVVTVSVGASQTFRDLEMGPVSFSRAHGKGAPVRVNLAFDATGMEGEKAVVEILHKGKAKASATAEIQSNDAHHELRLELNPETEGWVTYEVRVRPGRNAAGLIPNDEVAQNNSAYILVDNREKRYKVFYFSGRPNWENKFVQKALKNDKELDLTSVLRISAAETKFVYRGKQSSLVNPLFEGFYKDDMDQPRYDESVFLRFGGDRGLAGKGFPEDVPEMFGHHVLIVGEVEANFFSQDQLELMRDFVRKRGGVLLMLGGPHSFSEGQYQDTVLSSMLPVVLNKSGDKEGESATAHFKVNPTMEGLLSGTWTLHPTPDRNTTLWNELPELTGLNEFSFVRPHATTLARAESDEQVTDDQTFFAIVRYGEGRTAVLATGATWQWHMGTTSEDDRHGNFWRQLTRGLAADVPDPLMLRHKEDTYVVDKEINLEVLIRDERFDERSGLQTRLVLTDPEGHVATPGVEESILEAGVYKIRFTPRKLGTWHLKLTARDLDDKELGTLEEALLVTEDRREFQRARANPDFLARLATETGGAAFNLDQLKDIPPQIPYSRHDEAETVQLHFWHFPPFFLMLVIALCFEWYFRRKGGHA